MTDSPIPVAPAIETRDLGRDYGAARALEGINLTVSTGEIYGVVGANRSGKSTLMRILSIRERPSRGSVFLAGIDTYRDPRAARRQIGFAGPLTGIPAFTVVEELTVMARLRGVSVGLNDTIDTLLQLVDLEDQRHRPIGGLSAGDARRLSLARALVHDPAIILLDAPFELLDPATRSEVTAILRELRLLGKTILLTATSVAEVAGLCDLVAFLDRGRIVYEDAPANLLATSGLPLRIVLAEDTGRLARFLGARPGVTATRIVDDHVLLIWIDGGTAVQAALLADLVAGGFAILEFGFDAGQADIDLTRLAQSA